MKRRPFRATGPGTAPTPEMLKLTRRYKLTVSGSVSGVGVKNHAVSQVDQTGVTRRLFRATGPGTAPTPEPTPNHEQLLHRNVQRFRGGLVFKAHRLLHPSTLGSRVTKKKKTRAVSRLRGYHALHPSSPVGARSAVRAWKPVLSCVQR